MHISIAHCQQHLLLLQEKILQKSLQVNFVLLVSVIVYGVVCVCNLALADAIKRTCDSDAATWFIDFIILVLTPTSVLVPFFFFRLLCSCSLPVALRLVLNLFLIREVDVKDLFVYLVVFHLLLIH